MNNNSYLELLSKLNNCINNAIKNGEIQLYGNDLEKSHVVLPMEIISKIDLLFGDVLNDPSSPYSFTDIENAIFIKYMNNNSNPSFNELQYFGNILLNLPHFIYTTYQENNFGFIEFHDFLYSFPILDAVNIYFKLYIDYPTSDQYKFDKIKYIKQQEELLYDMDDIIDNYNKCMMDELRKESSIKNVDIGVLYEAIKNMDLHDILKLYRYSVSLIKENILNERAEIQELFAYLICVYKSKNNATNISRSDENIENIIKTVFNEKVYRSHLKISEEPRKVVSSTQTKLFYFKRMKKNLKKNNQKPTD